MSTTDIATRFDTTIAETLADDALERARHIAGTVARVIIQNDVEASRVSDQLAIIKDGRKILAHKLSGLLKPFKAMEAYARDRFRPIDNVLRDAEDVCKAEMGRYLIQKGQAAREERARLEREAAEVSARQAREAQTGPVPPPLELPPPEAPETVVQGRKSTTYVTTRLCVEIVDVAVIAAQHPELLKLDEAAAKILCRKYGIEGMAMPENGAIFHGMRFWRERSIGNR